MKKILILFVLTLLLCACSKKEELDEDTFVRIMSNEGFNVADVEYQFGQYDYIDEAYVAKNNNYQIEFYELEDKSYSKKFYNNNKNIFERSKTESYTYTNVDLINSNKYTLTTNDEYKVISRIGETIIYLNVKKEYKDEVNSILKKLGY